MLEPELVYRNFTGIPESFRRSMLREYLQSKALGYIFNSNNSPGLVFIGGTALRFFYGTRRFSEDLDFDSGNLSLDELTLIAKKTVREFQLEGVECTLSVKAGIVFSATIRFTDILQKWNLTGHRDEVMRIKLDAVPQNYSFHPEMKVLNMLDVFAAVPVAPASLLLAQKLYAILNRKRVMGRDLYDGASLFGITDPDMNYLAEKLDLKTPGEIAEKVLGIISGTSIRKLTEDVEPFLPRKTDLIRVELFPEILADWVKRKGEME